MITAECFEGSGDSECAKLQKLDNIHQYQKCFTGNDSINVRVASAQAQSGIGDGDVAKNKRSRMAATIEIPVFFNSAQPPNTTCYSCDAFFEGVI